MGWDGLKRFSIWLIQSWFQHWKATLVFSTVLVPLAENPVPSDLSRTIPGIDDDPVTSSLELFEDTGTSQT